MKIKNKYVFRIIISEFLYILKSHGSDMLARPRCLGYLRPRHGSGMVVIPRRVVLAFLLTIH
jgi:hypothetical protein